jgi:hypothetical protein
MKIYLPVLLILCLLSCGSKSQQDSVQFNIDKNLLAKRIQIDSLGFSFAPPVGWADDASKGIDQSLHKFQNEELSSYAISIKDIFYDSTSTNFCSISVIQSADSPDLSYFVKNFYNILSSQIKPEDLKQAHFSKEGLEITQFLIMSDSRVMFKLCFQPANTYIIQIDYAIDRSIYPNYIKKIESSIGSITTI